MSPATRDTRHTANSSTAAAGHGGDEPGTGHLRQQHGHHRGPGPTWKASVLPAEMAWMAPAIVAIISSTVNVIPPTSTGCERLPASSASATRPRRDRARRLCAQSRGASSQASPRDQRGTGAESGGTDRVTPRQDVREPVPGDHDDLAYGAGSTSAGSSSPSAWNGRGQASEDGRRRRRPRSRSTCGRRCARPSIRCAGS